MDDKVIVDLNKYLDINTELEKLRIAINTFKSRSKIENEVYQTAFSIGSRKSLQIREDFLVEFLSAVLSEDIDVLYIETGEHNYKFTNRKGDK